MKIVRKFTPVSLYDIPGLEQWFEEMGREGLFPLRTKEWTTFRDDGKPGTRFRLEPIVKGKEKEPPQAQIDLYRDAGWHYSSNMAGLYHLFYTTDPTAPELHTDWVTKGQSLDRLAKIINRAKWHHILWPILLPLCWLGLALLPGLAPPSRFDVQPDPWAYLPMALLALTSVALAAFFLMLVALYIGNLRQFPLLLKLHRNLKEGLPPPPSPGPRKGMVRWHKYSLGFTILALVFILLTRAAPLLPFSAFPLPYTSLEALEGTDLYTYGDSFGLILREEDKNRVEWNASLLAPVWYTVNQRGFLPLDREPEEGLPFRYSGGDYYYDPELKMTRLVLTFPSMARPVAKSVMDSMRLVNLEYVYEEVDHPEADFVILARTEDTPWQMAALGRGRQVAVFRYTGEIADHLDLLTDMVNQE